MKNQKNLIKFLKVLLVLWLIAGFAAMLYVLFIQKKSNILFAMIFIIGFAAIAIPLRRLTGTAQTEKSDKK